MIEVLHLPKFRNYFSDQDLAEFLALLHKKALIVEIGSKIRACRDPKDNYILEIAETGAQHAAFHSVFFYALAAPRSSFWPEAMSGTF